MQRLAGQSGLVTELVLNNWSRLGRTTNGHLGQLFAVETVYSLILGVCRCWDTNSDAASIPNLFARIEGNTLDWQKIWHLSHSRIGPNTLKEPDFARLARTSRRIHFFLSSRRFLEFKAARSEGIAHSLKGMGRDRKRLQDSWLSSLVGEPIPLNVSQILRTADFTRRVIADIEIVLGFPYSLINSNSDACNAWVGTYRLHAMDFLQAIEKCPGGELYQHIDDDW